MGIKEHKKLTKTKGFTIIEVMIVLAIAGIIMVIVFIAVPQLNKSVRDTHRKQYAREVFAEMENFYANNRRYPLTPADRQRFIDTYMPKDKDLLTGDSYTSNSSVTYADGNVDHANMPKPGQIFIASGHYCTSSNPTDINNTDPIDGNNDANNEMFVIWIGLEKGVFYCLDDYFKL